MLQHPSYYTHAPMPPFNPPTLTLGSIGLPNDPCKEPVSTEDICIVVNVYQVKKGLVCRARA